MQNVKRNIILFIALLWLSGLTAIPAQTELEFIKPLIAFFPQAMQDVYNHILEALTITNQKYPQLAYGYDWLAFGHIVIGMAFIYLYKKPKEYYFLTEWGKWACILVIPYASFFALVRSLPIWWIPIDCSFGVFGWLLLHRIQIGIKKHY